MPTITAIREIVSENPIEQVWKFLRYFLDVDSVSERIKQFHKIPEGKHEANIRKQAQQVRTCVRQAEEYFKASAKVSLATRPLLLYYGAVSLSQALILLRQDGKFSIDELRKNKRHRHHGLEIDYGKSEKIRKCVSINDFLSNLQCFVFTKSDKNKTRSVEQIKKDLPWGHFYLVYSCLSQEAFQYTRRDYEVGKTTHLETKDVQGCADLLPIDSIIGKPLNALDLVKTLPDMFFSLDDLGIQPDLCRGNIEIGVYRKFDNDAQGKKVCKNISEKFKFFIDGINPEQKKSFLDYYNKMNPEIKLLEDKGAFIVMQFSRDLVPDQPSPKIYFPDIAEDLSGRKFYILKPDRYLPETVTYLVLLFCLGYLARYYPDQWVSIIDTKVRIAEIVDSILNLAYRKFPNLILDQMTLVKHHIHL